MIRIALITCILLTGCITRDEARLAAVEYVTCPDHTPEIHAITDLEAGGRHVVISCGARVFFLVCSEDWRAREHCTPIHVLQAPGSRPAVKQKQGEHR